MYIHLPLRTEVLDGFLYSPYYRYAHTGHGRYIPVRIRDEYKYTPSDWKPPEKIHVREIVPYRSLCRISHLHIRG